MPTFRWTTKAAPDRRAFRRGFTLVEISVVLVVLVLIAGVVVPHFAAMKQTRDLQVAEASIARLPAEARNEARKSQIPVRLRVDGAALVMERVPPDQGAAPQISALPAGTVTQLGGAPAAGTASQAGGVTQEVKRVALTDAVKIENATQNGSPIDPASWQWTVYPDGSSDTGGIEFSEGSARKSLVLLSGGDTQWITGDLPDTTQQSWPAGALLQRG